MRAPAPLAGWIDALRALGEALFAVVRAELTVLAEDWRRAGRRYALAAGLLFLALCGVFWLVALLLFAAVELVARWLPLWGAALVVAGGLAALIAAAAGVGYALFRRTEDPLGAARRRVDDHLGWWRRRMLVEEEEPEGDDDG